MGFWSACQQQRSILRPNRMSTTTAVWSLSQSMPSESATRNNSWLRTARLSPITLTCRHHRLKISTTTTITAQRKNRTTSCYRAMIITKRQVWLWCNRILNLERWWRRNNVDPIWPSMCLRQINWSRIRLYRSWPIRSRIQAFSSIRWSVQVWTSWRVILSRVVGLCLMSSWSKLTAS